MAKHFLIGAFIFAFLGFAGYTILKEFLEDSAMYVFGTLVSAFIGNVIMAKN